MIGSLKWRQIGNEPCCDENMQIKWRYFLKPLGNPEIEFQTVITSLAAFLSPVWKALTAENEFARQWESIEMQWKSNSKSFG